MFIQQEDDGEQGAFYVEENNERLGEMTYRWGANDLMIIDHTEVDKKLEGKGVAKQLVKSAVDLARKKHFKILPMCSYAKAVLSKDDSYKDVLK